jgi:hypothetical protein
MDVLYYPPPLASGNITHPCNSRYLGKIFLYIDHNHMEYLYNIYVCGCVCVWLGWPLWNICVTNDHGYVPLVVNTSFPHSWLSTGFVTRLTRRVPLVEQEPLTLQGHLSSPPVFSGVRVTRSLVLCVCFEDRCLSIYGFWLPLWYLQTLLKSISVRIRISWQLCTKKQIKCLLSADFSMT